MKATQPDGTESIIREMLAAILVLPDDKLAQVYRYVQTLADAPAFLQATQGEIRVGVTAVELRRLPAADRARILQAQAAAAAIYYNEAQETAERMAWQAGDITDYEPVKP